MAALVLAGVVGTAVPAWAAAPDNDTYAGRTVIGSLPSNQTLDTTEATTDADDAPINAPCGYPATDASVWYEVTAPATGTMVVNLFDSSYSAGAVVATGSPGNWTVVGGCISGYGTPTVVAGQTYTIIVFDDQWDGGGNGGTLNISLDWGPAPPTLAFTVNTSGRVDARTGTAILSGTATCTNASWASASLELRQPVGRLSISGYGYTDFVCDGVTHTWTAEISPYNGGKFAGGKATATAYAYACGTLECRDASDQRTIQLR
jgi:hypothetical protein